MFRILSKPRVEMGVSWNRFQDDVRWRFSWEECNIADKEMNPLSHSGERKKYTETISFTTHLYLLQKPIWVMPYIGVTTGFFKAYYYQKQEDFNVLSLKPEFRRDEDIYTFEKGPYDYKGQAISIKFGLDKYLHHLPAGFYIEIERIYFIIRQQTLHLPSEYENFNYT